MKVTIFLSHTKEVEEDIKEIEIAIHRAYQDSDIKLIIEHYSESDKSFHTEGYQSRLNDILVSCDILYIFLERRVGQYTEEEFWTGYKSFQKRRLPYLSVFFKKFTLSDDASDEEWEHANYRRKFKKELSSLDGNQYIIEPLANSNITNSLIYSPSNF